jgi:tRNA(fMet)-specific endonuclease VapC
MIRSLMKLFAWARSIARRNAPNREASVLILDSDVLTIVQRAEGPAFERLVTRLDAEDEVAITVISLEEQARGWLAYIAKQRSFDRQVAAYTRLTDLVDDFSTRRILEFDAAAAAEASVLSSLT